VLLSDYALQVRLIFALIVAGKTAKFAGDKTSQLLGYAQEGESPFEMLQRLAEKNLLRHALETVKTGNYSKLKTAFEHLPRRKLDLRTCTPDELESVPGIGPKTSRFFILWTRPNAEYAALDVHILRWLRALGYLAPWVTPNTPRAYRRWEQVFLKEAASRKMKPAALDAEIWGAGERGEVIP
jgi:thermostable 8-oxoguanine DNA glycosylase